MPAPRRVARRTARRTSTRESRRTATPDTAQPASPEEPAAAKPPETPAAAPVLPDEPLSPAQPPLAEPPSESDAEAPPGGVVPDVAQRLSDLDELHDQGVLTNEQYEEAKKRIVG